ncbi:MAG: HD domain-containing protein, partial [Bacilli bacterium]|nr:HD domain-containing protein [Bacilli bacterium]
FLLVPIFMFVIHDFILKKKPSIFYWRGFRIHILISVTISVLIFNIALTNHSLILIVVPTLVAAQYRNERRVLLWVGLAAVLLVPLGVYGGFFFGNLDRNLVKGAVDASEATLEARWELAKNGRMVSLLIHHVLPRILCVLAVNALCFGILARNYRMIASQAKLQDEIEDQIKRTSYIQERVADNLAALIENRDVSTGEHVIRTKAYVALICEELIKTPIHGHLLDKKEAALIIRAAPLHDVGKIKVSDLILKKPGKLTPEEFEQMKLHSSEGEAVIHSILDNIEEEDFIRVAEEIAVYHHEKWDGTGYPRHLKGEEIPLSARIMAVADVFDALVSKRVYKEPYPIDEALKIIEDSSGTHFDPGIARAFLNCKDKVIEVALKNIDD